MEWTKLLTPEGRENRITFNTHASILYNFILAIGKLSLGIYNISFFLCINAFYNLGIALAKIVAIKGFKNSYLYDTHHGYGHAAYRSYIKVGFILSISAFIYILYSARLFIMKEPVDYSNMTSITIALVSFVEIGLAMYGTLTTSKENEPSINAIKMTNLSSSLISLVLTQTAAISFMHNDDISFYHGLIGVIFGVIAMIIGIYMVFHMSNILNGKNSKTIIKRFDTLLKKEKLTFNYTFIRYEDYGPNNKYLYIQSSDDRTYIQLKNLTKRKLSIELVNQIT
ncbi:MAG: hypothetical protein ACK5LC_07635 [Coprobacillaceae bacterium]